MASRIVVIDECKHGKHEAHGYFAAFCEGGSCRVLTEGDLSHAVHAIGLCDGGMCYHPNGVLQEFLDAARRCWSTPASPI